jgi:hypothetical protein
MTAGGSFHAHGMTAGGSFHAYGGMTAAGSFHFAEMFVLNKKDAFCELETGD